LKSNRKSRGRIGLDTLTLRRRWRSPSALRDTMRLSRSEPGWEVWRGRIALSATRLLPGGGELRPVSGIVKSDGQSMIFEPPSRANRGGEVTANSRCEADREWNFVNARSNRRCRWRGLLSGWRTARGSYVRADDAEEPGPQRVGAEGCGCPEVEPSRGIRSLRRLDPRAFYRGDPLQR